VYASLVLPIVEYETSFWDLYKERKINASDRVQNKAVNFAHQRNDSNSEILAQCRKIPRIWATFNAYTGERTWTAISDRM
jgi:hypothetical protein